MGGCMGKTPKKPHASSLGIMSVAPEAESQLNDVLNRWRSGEVTLLQRKFREARGSAMGLSQERLIGMFQLQGLGAHIGDNLLAVFLSDRSRHEVDFKDFCRALALCCRGGRKERFRFLFDIFSGKNQPKYLGYNPTPEAPDEVSGSNGPSTNVDLERSSSFQQPLPVPEKQEPYMSSDAVAELSKFCNVESPDSGPDLSFHKFLSWAMKGNLPDQKVEEALFPFYLLPSPQMEKQGFIKAVQDFNLEPGLQVYLVSWRWWLRWVFYVRLSDEEQSQLLHIGELVDPSTLRMGTPPENDPKASRTTRTRRLSKTKRGSQQDSSINTRASTSVLSEFRLSMKSPAQSNDAEAASYIFNPNDSPSISHQKAHDKEMSFPAKVVSASSMTIASMRPDEIDNTDLQGLAEWELRKGLQLGVDFVIWPKEGWEIMAQWYGGGPVFQRRIVRSETDVPKRKLDLDLYPIALSVNHCDIVGKPGLIEKLVLVSKTDKLAKVVAEICQMWRIRLGHIRHNHSSVDTSGTSGGSAFPDATEELPPLADYATVVSNVRVWTFDLDRSQKLQEDKQPEDDSQPLAQAASMNDVGDSTARRQQNAVSVQSVGRWELLPEINMKQTMQDLEFRSGQSLMLEIKILGGVWPRERYIEAPDFRDFTQNDRVDAMDYRGRWYTGIVISVESTDGEKKVLVHFDKFATKWDEWFPTNSSRLAPYGSYTAVAPQPNLATQTLDETTDENTMNSPKKATLINRSKSEGNSLKGSTGNLAHKTTTAQTSEGINNYNNVSINRRSHTTGQPPIPGVCGLVNMGNTCFANSALQCLSHTPLLRAYLLSDFFVPEVNRNNPLGTQGRLIEEVAELLKMLWSNDYLCVLPSRFRRTLSKHKQQFSGNDQQDSQEFLAEMLDSLHEDVNRVREKPTVPALEDSETEGKSERQLAKMFWDRHLLRNRSVIVDLFQGQLKVELTCPECNKKSTNFDPFMHLSVPIPVQLEKAVEVTLILRVRRSTERQNLMPVRYGLLLPRLGEISDLKKALSDLAKIPKENLTITDVYRHKFHRIFDDGEPLALLRDDDVIVAFEKTRCIAPKTVTKPKHSVRKPDGAAKSRRTKAKKSVAVEDGESSSTDSSTKRQTYEDEEDDGTDFDEPYPAGSKMTSQEAQNQFPVSFADLEMGMRVDAMDSKRTWYSGTVIGVQKSRIRVHFDWAPTQWDEWYTESEWTDGRLAPLHSKAPRQRRAVEVQLVNVRVSSPGTPGPASPNKEFRWGTSPKASSSGRELFGVPLLIHCDSNKTKRYFHRLVLQQVTRFLKPEEAAITLVNRVISGKKDWDEVSSSSSKQLPFTLNVASTHNPLADLTSLEPLSSDPNTSLMGTISNKMMIVVDWHDPSQYEPAGMHWVDHSSYLELNNATNAAKARGEGVTLASCLHQFTKEETLDEADSWYCPRCKTHRRCRIRTTLWSMPDVLVVSVKRFHCSARYREKIRTLVYFPQSGLDVTEWVDKNSEQAQLEKGALVYDLYAVVNHVGGMTGGHYTAFCRSVPCSQNGIEEVGTGNVGGPWLHFDDEFVEEISPDKVVSEAAYVLFYRKRRITPSNVITMTV